MLVINTSTRKHSFDIDAGRNTQKTINMTKQPELRHQVSLTFIRRVIPSDNKPVHTLTWQIAGMSV
jgi:hypothetical protein